MLVCSDGLWNYASEPDELATQLQKTGGTDPAALALALVGFANARVAQDNITVTLARVETGQNAADIPPAAPTETAPDTAPDTKTEGESDG